MVVRVEDQICVGLEIDEGAAAPFLDPSVLDREAAAARGPRTKALHSTATPALIKTSNEGKRRCKSKITNLMGGDDMTSYFLESWTLGRRVCWWWECHFRG